MRCNTWIDLYLNCYLKVLEQYFDKPLSIDFSWQDRMRALTLENSVNS